jgi:hypothetical protein
VGVGFGVRGSRFSVHGSGCRVKGYGFRVQEKRQDESEGDVQQFRGGLVFKVYHSTLGLRVIKKKEGWTLHRKLVELLSAAGFKRRGKGS